MRSRVWGEASGGAKRTQMPRGADRAGEEDQAILVRIGKETERGRRNPR